jgi:hypothetical protein
MIGNSSFDKLLVALPEYIGRYFKSLKKLLIILIISHSALICGQVTANDRIMSIGISEGIGGAHLLLSPTLDFSVKKTIIKISSIPIYPRFLSFGLAQDIKTFRNENLKWIVSADYFQTDGSYWQEIIDASSYRGFCLLSGMRLSLFGSLKLNLQLGLLFLSQNGGFFVNTHSTSVNPYGELSLSYSVFRFGNKS